ncbi:hypothetical protein A1Q1_02467 [Trichosporon asahii var. asahii CBS 2479]|uniref:Uncharacterized protein n=1 Tax=Trichosporon asahii var. asahii (strain ATCC 90039 / CBS 2479 / JCM 2466 / KCTC 7840 / NBRC 103889/ NCYC 2677 / UAMH 7654) TaxID=1186058 RepID=J6EVF0_TRIAS|nr:hypothetical protein A1Q1_02467 [Trichosporon asahii var. asahii CBS 2479]EJT48559.1 hypothetical protein A1Q1_02467 [Trichosporon asahii var. asahii CBS 2479]
MGQRFSRPTRDTAIDADCDLQLLTALAIYSQIMSYTESMVGEGGSTTNGRSRVGQATEYPPAPGRHLQGADLPEAPPAKVSSTDNRPTIHAPRPIYGFHGKGSSLALGTENPRHLQLAVAKFQDTNHEGSGSGHTPSAADAATNIAAQQPSRHFSSDRGVPRVLPFGTHNAVLAATLFTFRPGLLQTAASPHNPVSNDSSSSSTPVYVTSEDSDEEPDNGSDAGLWVKIDALDVNANEHEGIPIGSDNEHTDGGESDSAYSSAASSQSPRLTVNNLQEALALHRLILRGRDEMAALRSARPLSPCNWQSADESHQFRGFRPALIARLQQLGLGPLLVDMEALIAAEPLDDDPEFSVDEDDDGELDYLACNSLTSHVELAAAAKLVSKYHRFMAGWWSRRRNRIGPSGPDSQKGKERKRSAAYLEFAAFARAHRTVSRREWEAEDSDEDYEEVGPEDIWPIEGTGRHDLDTPLGPHSWIVRPDEMSDYESQEMLSTDDDESSDGDWYSSVVGVASEDGPNSGW